jgi:hypothetical protein
MELNRCLLATLLWVGPPGSAQAPNADFLLPEPAAKPPAALALALEGLRANALAVHINLLASPRLEGRGLGTRGLDLGAEYLATRLAEAGLAPFGDAVAGQRTPSWFQAVPFRRLRQPSATLTLRFPAGEPLRLASGAEGLFPKLAPGSVSVPLVFAGHGLREKALNHDDFQGLEVKGKAVLFLGGLPPGDGWRQPPFLTRYTPEDPDDRYDARLEVLRKLGAAMAIALEEDFPEPNKARKLAAEAAFLDPAEAPPAEGPSLVRIPAAKAKELLARLGIGMTLPGATATLDSTGLLQVETSRNVLAVLPGSDPKVRDEAVVLGAHYDHLGRVDGVIRPGADDNASGVAALLEIARAFAASPRKPRRTLVFAFWTGEEEGKFGSSHYVRHPSWPLQRTRAYLNLDMIGHPWTAAELRKLVAEARLEPAEAYLAAVKPADFIEPGVASSAPWLGQVLAAAASHVGAPLHLDWTDGLHGGSDYRPFARAGVPFVRFFGNFFPDYHKPGDTPDQVDPAQALKITRLALATAWLLAER